MHDEAFLLPDQKQHLVQVEPLQRVDIVMQVGLDRACRVEKAFHDVSVFKAAKLVKSCHIGLPCLYDEVC